MLAFALSLAGTYAFYAASSAPTPVSPPETGRRFLRVLGAALLLTVLVGEWSAADAAGGGLRALCVVATAGTGVVLLGPLLPRITAAIALSALPAGVLWTLVA